ncbi:MAG: hypothetical protein OMM_14889 [Candidatus Magnetoglobus multicellularis str. Araruama]|uniref:Uncharacterized protein n=1 Tax=Candidatus Magnetoglobus multicellularis str. Araruama TaxID=890399 RepID=A0A1V1NR42_9BACT|nr:MAG: hypothetical protein OMM_14889 [Candidatus Magnetoglobus multicellularis str. Araruama]
MVDGIRYGTNRKISSNWNSPSNHSFKEGIGNNYQIYQVLLSKVSPEFESMTKQILFPNSAILGNLLYSYLSFNIN